jgi:hypothetical protein
VRRRQVGSTRMAVRKAHGPTGSERLRSRRQPTSRSRRGGAAVGVLWRPQRGARSQCWRPALHGRVGNFLSEAVIAPVGDGYPTVRPSHCPFSATVRSPTIGAKEAHAAPLYALRLARGGTSSPLLSPSLPCAGLNICGILGHTGNPRQVGGRAMAARSVPARNAYGGRLIWTGGVMKHRALGWPSPGFAELPASVNQFSRCTNGIGQWAESLGHRCDATEPGRQMSTSALSTTRE